MPSDKNPAPQPSQGSERLREAGNIEKRGGWQKPTAQPSAMNRPQGMPDKPQGGQGGQGGGQEQSDSQ
ncbi:MAG: hypothetical protein ACLQVF_02275 [Isosphaeraceae bacterium]